MKKLILSLTMLTIAGTLPAKSFAASSATNALKLPIGQTWSGGISIGENRNLECQLSVAQAASGKIYARIAALELGPSGETYEIVPVKTDMGNAYMDTESAGKLGPQVVPGPRDAKFMIEEMMGTDGAIKVSLTSKDLGPGKKWLRFLCVGLAPEQ